MKKLAADQSVSLGTVVSLGAHILDILGRPITDIPPGQGSRIIDEIRITAAGTAAGVSVDLAKLGAPVRSIGAVGDDLMGEVLESLMKRNGVDTSLLVHKANQTTSATMLPIRPNGERPALHAPGASGDFSDADISSTHLKVIRDASVLHIGGPDSLPKFDPSRLATIAADAKSSGATITLDMLRLGVPGDLDHWAPLFEQVDWFLPNDDQIRSLTGCADLADASRRIRDMGVGGVAVTMGAAGCLIDDGDRVVELPAMPVTVVDTTGCGDGFDAGFIFGLLLRADPLDAAWLATACGGLVATGLGSDAGIVDLDATLSMLEHVEQFPSAVAASQSLRTRFDEVASIVGDSSTKH